jgi:CBS domain containing-hemolysin-like protein
MAWELAVAVVLVLANGFFVAVEFSVARLRPTQAAEMVRDGRPGAKSALHAVEHIDAYLSACQLGITVSSLGLGAIGEPAFHHLLEPVLGDGATVAGFGLASVGAFLIITTLHVVIGELSPKSAAIARTVPVVLALAPIMRAFYFVTSPVVDAFNAMGNLVLKPFGVPPASEAGHQPHSEDELRELLRQSSREGLIERAEQELSEAALLFGDTRARDVMKPRGEIDFVATTDEPQSIARRAIDTGRTRLPICEPEGGLDATVGSINAKDLLPMLFRDADDFDLSKAVRPMTHISESVRVDEILREMREQRQHVALVHDEHGTVVGLLTMEDILEELVGEIEDEFDERHEDHFGADDDGRLLVEGQAPIRALAERLGFDLDEHHETTVGGYISGRLARVPEPGETVELHGHRAEILSVDETRIATVAVDERDRGA